MLCKVCSSPSPRSLVKAPQPAPDHLLRAGLALSGGLQAWLCSQGRALESYPVLWRLSMTGWEKESHRYYLQNGPGPRPRSRADRRPQTHPHPSRSRAALVLGHQRHADSAFGVGQRRLGTWLTYLPHGFGSAPRSQPEGGGRGRPGGHCLSAPSQGHSS
jgi:hypothetical protein